MAKIGISLNEVLRDFINQFIYTYTKYLDQDFNVTTINDFDLTKSCSKIDSINQLNTFLYVDAPLEIFGHADTTIDNLAQLFNEFLLDISDDEEHDITIVSREVNRSIPATFFFLSKIGLQINSVRFVNQNEDEWCDFDLLITANPIALKNQPKNKKSIKIKTSYNADTEADYEVDSILDIIKNKEIINTILNKN